MVTNSSSLSKISKEYEMYLRNLKRDNLSVIGNRMRQKREPDPKLLTTFRVYNVAYLGGECLYYSYTYKCLYL